MKKRKAANRMQSKRLQIPMQVVIDHRVPASIENPELTSLVDKLLDILKTDKGTKLHFTQNECSTTEYANS